MELPNYGVVGVMCDIGCKITTSRKSGQYAGGAHGDFSGISIAVSRGWKRSLSSQADDKKPVTKRLINGAKTPLRQIGSMQAQREGSL